MEENNCINEQIEVDYQVIFCKNQLCFCSPLSLMVFVIMYGYFSVLPRILINGSNVNLIFVNYFLGGTR